jgi:hypothetical protein
MINALVLWYFRLMLSLSDRRMLSFTLGTQYSGQGFAALRNHRIFLEGKRSRAGHIHREV